MHRVRDLLMRLRQPARTRLAAQLQAVHTMIGSLEKRIVAQHRSNEASKRLETILGIGIIGATTIAAVIPDRRVFRSGRDFAAVGRRREKRGLGAAPGVRSSSRWGWQPLRPSHHVLEEKALQQRDRRRICLLYTSPSPRDRTR